MKKNFDFKDFYKEIGFIKQDKKLKNKTFYLFDYKISTLKDMPNFFYIKNNE